MKNHFVGGDYSTIEKNMKVSELNVDNDGKKIFTFHNPINGENLFFKLIAIVPSVPRIPKKYFFKDMNTHGPAIYTDEQLRDDTILGYIEEDQNLPTPRTINGGKRMRKGKKSLKNKKKTNKKKSKKSRKSLKK